MKPKMGTLIWFTFFVAFFLAEPVSMAQDSGAAYWWETESIRLNGNASGGELILCETLNRNAAHVSISTQAGESAESVAKRLAEVINKTNPFRWLGHVPGREIVLADGGVVEHLVGERGSYFFAGTETGLGIPPPPRSLSCSYQKDLNQIHLEWINPPGGYEDLMIVINWDNYKHKIGNLPIPGNRSDFILDLKDYPMDVNNGDFWLIGYREGTPSDVGAIHLNGNAQEELFGVPFANGVAPNWQRWSSGVTPNTHRLTSNIDENLAFVGSRRGYNPIKTAASKPFKQALTTPAEGGTVGISRKFLGLTPGHTYRLSARLSTLEMDPNSTGWSFSLHAVPDSPGVEKLSDNQMAGLAALPDGRSGPQAARLKILDSANITGGKYEEYSSDMTLPQDSNSITVWLRLTGTREAEVGFDWIKLEDLSAN
jgi:hypothetical protein